MMASVLGPPPQRDPPGLTVRAASGAALFWLLPSVAGAAINGAIAHIVPLLTDSGMSGRAATATAGRHTSRDACRTAARRISI